MRNCVPANWDVAELGDIAEARSGYGFPESLQGRTNGEVPFFKVGDISRAVLSHRDLLTTAQHYITEEEAAQIGARVLPKNTVVFAKIGEAVKLNRRAALAQDSLVDNNVMGLIPNSAVVPTYLLHFMRTVDLGVLSQATTVPSVRKGDVQRVKIPIAPMGEQNRIVEAIESYLTRLDNAVALLERVEENLKRYRASVLKAAVEGRLVPTEAELARREGRSYEPASGLLKRILAERKTRWIEDAAEKARAKADEKARKAGQPWTAKDDAATLERERGKAANQYKEPAAPDTTDLPDLPEGWCWASVEQVAQIAVGPAFKSSEFSAEGIRLLRGGNIEPGALRWEEERTRYWPEDRIGGYDSLLVEEGDVILAMDRPVVSAGLKLALAGERDVPSLLVQRVARLRTYVLPATFLHLAMSLDRFIEHLQAGQTGTQLPHVSGTGIGTYALALPPLAEQQRILEAVDNFLSPAEMLCTSLGAAARRSARLRQSILKWAFEGKLVEQDPNDEPASVLLERVRVTEAGASK